jgi:hypothetical protein
VALTAQDKEFIYESFKSPVDEAGRPITDLDSCSDHSGATSTQHDAKLIVLSKLEKLRSNTRGQRVKELISLDEDGVQMAIQKKIQGLKPAGEEQLIEIALSNLLGWSKIWREIRTLDIDRNGFIERHEFEQLLRDTYPFELQPYSLIGYLEKYPCSYDANLINYLPIKNALNARIAKIIQEQREKKKKEELRTYGDGPAKSE